MSTDLDARPTIDTVDGSHDRFCHIVSRAAQMRGYVYGEQVTALCGKRFVPCRDPEQFELCPTCKERLAAIRARRT